MRGAPARELARDRVEPGGEPRRARVTVWRRVVARFTQRALHCEHALRPAQRIEFQAPLHHGHQLARVRFLQPLQQPGHAILGAALVGRLRRRARHAREHARADAVDVGPGAELLVLAIELRRREARRVHRKELRTVLRERLASRPEVEQHRRAVHAQVDVGRLEVEVKHPVGVHLAQPVHDLVEHASHVSHREHLAPVAHRARVAAAVVQDQFLQAAAFLVVHHQVDGVVGAKKVHDPHHVRVDDACQRAALLEEALQAVAVGGGVLGGHRRREFARAASHERAGQVFLDRETPPLGIEREVDDREATARNLSCDTIAPDLEVVGKRCVGLRSHLGGVWLAASPRTEASPHQPKVSFIHKHRGPIRINQEHDRLRVGHARHCRGAYRA